MLFGLFVLTFALVQVCIIGVSFEENDPSAAPKADYYLTLGALVNPDGQPSAALAARCDAAIGVLNANPGRAALSCAADRAATSRAPRPRPCRTTWYRTARTRNG